MEEFAGYDNLAFETADDMESLVRDADVVVSCITSAEGLLVEDLSPVQARRARGAGPYPWLPELRRRVRSRSG